jgi:AraC family transcriptional regulator, glycine betaine-responsive activator
MKREQNTIFMPERSALEVTLLVFSGSSIMSVASTVDPLRAANRVTGETRFSWRIVTADGEPAVTTSGLPVPAAGRFDAAAAGDVLIVIAGFGVTGYSRHPVLSTLRRAVTRCRAFGGVESGSWLLGHAGLLDGRRATTHWEDLEDFAAAFPAVDVRPDRYVIDGPVFTTGGASPTFDMMLHLVRSRLGMAAALDVASIFIYDEAHASSDAQPLVSVGRLDGYDPRLGAAIRMMEAHVDTPLTIAAIARRVGVTARTLEKLFGQAVGESPGRYYLRLRLSAARRLVTDTRADMAMIAERTGFSSAAAFSRAFRGAFKMPPARMRKGAGG